MTGSFAHPERLAWLILTVAWAAWMARGAARRASAWRSLGMRGRPTGQGGILAVVGAALIVVALAQPRWGRVPGSPALPGHDLIILLDVSRSMAAEDALPDRLGLAVEAAAGLIRSLGPGDRAGLVAFAGRGVVRCPLTEDLDAVANALRALRPGSVAPGGTDLGAGLDAAASAFDSEMHAEGRTVVVFTDGEDHAGRWPIAAARLAALGAVVHAVAIGDADAGHPVPTASGVLMYRGEPVATRRRDADLADLARATDGTCLRLGLAVVDLGPLFRNRLAPRARARRDARRPADRAERFQPLLAAALVFIAAATWPTRRPRRVHRWGVALAIPALLAAAGPPVASSPAREVEAGRASYATGRFAEGLAHFERAIALDPVGAIPRYNAAASLFRLGRFNQARARYVEARDRANPALRAKVDYALGNVALAMGQVPAAIGHYEACLAGEIGPVRRNAAINLRFARAQSPKTEAGRDDGPGPAPDRPDRDPDSPGDAPKSPGPASPGAGAPAGGDPSGRRGDGGAGGDGVDARPPGSPASRLAEALEAARGARRARLPEVPPPGPDSEIKDW